MRQNDIYEAYLDPVVGSEQGGRRPVVIVSGNVINGNAANILTCPITSSLKYYEGNPILEPSKINGLTMTSEIMVFQMRSISKERLKKKIGKISLQQMEQIKETLHKLMSY